MKNNRSDVQNYAAFYKAQYIGISDQNAEWFAKAALDTKKSGMKIRGLLSFINKSMPGQQLEFRMDKNLMRPKRMSIMNIFNKTFGGLSNAYYIRSFLFGMIFPAILITILISSSKPIPITFWVVMVVNTILYPYSRFVYESIVGYILGSTFVIANIGLLIFVKLTTMLLCWGFSVFVAPIGMVYLYFYHTKNEKNAAEW